MLEHQATSVDVIMPTKGRVPFFLEALQTLVDQTHRPLHVIVVDDGCSDEEIQRIDHALEAATKDAGPGFSAVRIRHAGAGAAAARNAGFRYGQSPYVLWMDSDDWLLPHKLEHGIKLLTSGEFDFVVSRAQHKQNGRLIEAYWGESVLKDRARFHFPFQTMCAILKRSFIQKENLHWNERLDSTNDWEFSNRALLAAKSFHYSKEVTAIYRTPAKSSQSIGSVLTRGKIESQLRGINKVLKINKRSFGSIGGIYRIKHVRHAWFLLGASVKRGSFRTSVKALGSMVHALTA